MTKKADGNAFDRFELAQGLKDDFVRCVDFYGMSESAMMRLMIAEYIDEWKTRYPDAWANHRAGYDRRRPVRSGL